MKKDPLADISSGTRPNIRGREGTFMDGVMGMQMAQFQTNYTFALMKMSMEDAQNQAAAMVEMMSSVPAPAQYGFDVWA
jgi:hypothetical protein